MIIALNLEETIAWSTACLNIDVFVIDLYGIAVYKGVDAEPCSFCSVRINIEKITNSASGNIGKCDRMWLLVGRDDIAVQNISELEIICLNNVGVFLKLPLKPVPFMLKPEVLMPLPVLSPFCVVASVVAVDASVSMVVSSVDVSEEASVLTVVSLFASSFLLSFLPQAVIPMISMVDKNKYLNLFFLIVLPSLFLIEIYIGS